MSEETEITLEDVEIMIGVLERFVRLSKKASRVLKALAPSRGSRQGDFMQTLMASMMEQKMAGAEAAEELEEDMEIDEETADLVKKIRARQKVEK